MSQGLILNQNEDIDTRFVSGTIGKLFIYWDKSSQVPAHPWEIGEDNSILYKNSPYRDRSEHFTENPIALQAKCKVNIKTKEPVDH